MDTNTDLAQNIGRDITNLHQDIAEVLIKLKSVKHKVLIHSEAGHFRDIDQTLPSLLQEVFDKVHRLNMQLGLITIIFERTQEFNRLLEAEVSKLHQRVELLESR